MALLNTHATVKKFVHFGLSEDQAEAIVEAINEQNNELATKTDINALKESTKADISILRSEMNNIKTELKAEILEVRSELKAEIANAKSSTLKWVVSLFIGALTVNLGTIGVVIAFLVK